MALLLPAICFRRTLNNMTTLLVQKKQLFLTKHAYWPKVFGFDLYIDFRGDSVVSRTTRAILEISFRTPGYET